MSAELPEVGARTRAAWRAWLARHHAQPGSVWLVYPKKDSPEFDDLARALADDAAARRHFDAFPPGARKIILTWITTAKRDATRAARVAETVRLAHENRRANHFRG